jgi:hypothetical protein
MRARMLTLTSICPLTQNAALQPPSPATLLKSGKLHLKTMSGNKFLFRELAAPVMEPSCYQPVRAIGVSGASTSALKWSGCLARIIGVQHWHERALPR